MGSQSIHLTALRVAELIEAESTSEHCRMLADIRATHHYSAAGFTGYVRNQIVPVGRAEARALVDAIDINDMSAVQDLFDRLAREAA